MRNTIILTVAACAAFAAAAAGVSAQTTTTPSQTARPVMPAPREATPPNANVNPMSNSLTEGRAVAPAAPQVERAPTVNRK